MSKYFNAPAVPKNSSSSIKEINIDGLNFIEPLKKLGPAIDNIEDIVPEIADLDADEWNELITFVSENWDLDTENEDDDLSERIEDGLNAGIELVRMTQLFKV